MVRPVRIFALATASVLASMACQKVVGIHDYRPRADAAGSGGPGGGAGAPAPGTGGGGQDGGHGDGQGAGQDGGVPEAKQCPASTTYWTGTAYRLSAGPHSQGSGQGECGFPNAELPATGYYAAVDATLFNSMPTCGACLHVENASDPTAAAEVEIIDAIGATVVAGDHAFAVDDAVHDLLMPNGSNPRIKAWVVPCGAARTIKLRFQTTGGVPAIYVFETRLPVESVQFKTGQGTYASLTRGTDGLRGIWSPPAGVTAGPNATFRLTDQVGDSVEVTVPVQSGTLDTHVQFPACLP